MTLTAYVDGERVDPGELSLLDSETGERHEWTGHGVEALLACSDRARLDEAHQGIDTAELVRLALADRESHADDGWSYASLVEREAAQERDRFEAHLAGRAPAGSVRVTIEGAAPPTGNGSAYIVDRDGATREGDGHRLPLAEFLRTWLGQVVGLSLEDAEEAARVEAGAGVAGCRR